MKNKSLSLLLIFLWFFGFTENLLAQKRKPAPRKTIIGKPTSISQASFAHLNAEQQRRLTTFYFAWQTIKTNYFDQTFGGLDWEKIRKEFEPRVTKAATDEQLHALLQEMINRLEKSHFAIVPPEVFQAIETAKITAKAKEENRRSSNEAGTYGDESAEEEKLDFSDFTAKYGIGVELRLMENQFIISRVIENSAAAKAGIKTGFVVEKINDVSLGELLKQIEIHFSKIRNVKRHLAGELVDYMLNGEKDSSVILTVSGEIGQSRKIEIQRKRLNGETISIGENFPEQFLQFESVSIDEQIGYIKFDVFALPVIEKFCSALTELKDKRAISN
jgi:C-terminal processing protease CtpA/Prc